MENDNKIRKAKEKLEALLLEGIRSGPATPMTKKDWAEIRRAAHERAKARKRHQLQAKINRGIAQLDRGEGIPGPAARAEMQRYRADALKARRMEQTVAINSHDKRVIVPMRPARGKWLVNNLKQTCPAAPAQWEGNIGARGSIYIRYRHGVLRVDLSKTHQKAWQTGATIFRKEIGDKRDGYMETKKMKRELADLCHFQGRTKIDPDW